MIKIETVEKAITGDESAITELYNETYQTSYSIAVSMIKDENEAFDILQESYISAFKNLEKLQDKSKFNSWLNHIVSNKCKDYFRKKKSDFLADNTYSSDEGEIEVELEDKNLTFSPEENMDYSETKRIIAEMLNNLPDDQRMVILMYYMQDMSIKEIAEILDVSENTVKSRMNYGKKKLKSQVEDLEKKGTKLYGISGIAILPFISWLLRSNAKNITIPDSSMVTSKLPLLQNNTITSNSTEISNSNANVTPKNIASNSPYSSVAGTTAIKKASKHIIRKIIALIIATSVTATTVAAVVSPKFRYKIDVFDVFNGPDKVVYKLETAINEHDINKIIECFSPKIQSKYKFSLGIASAATNAMGFGSITDEFANGVFGEVMGDITFSFKVIDVDYKTDNDAVATVEVSDSKSNKIQTEPFELVKISDKWYLSDKYMD